MSKFSYVLFLAFMFVSMLHATNPVNFGTPAPVTTQEACDLMAPTNFDVTNIGTTSVTLSWNVVPDAMQYKIRTYNVSTGFLVSDIYINGNVNNTTINGLNPGTSYRSEIRSICQSGQPSPNLVDKNYQTFILDLVVSGFTESTNSPNCSISAQGGNSCSFSWNSSPTTFKIVNGENSKQFTIQVINGHVNIKILNNTGFCKFWGIMPINGMPAAPSVFNIACVRISTAGGDTQIADLYIDQLTSSIGNIYLGPTGIAQGYEIQRLKSGSLPFSNDNGSSTISDNPLSADVFALQERRVDNNLTHPKTMVMANPFSDEISLKIQSTVEDLISLQLYDIQGRLIKHQDLAGGETQYSMPTSDIQPGLYLLRVEIGAFVATYKLIKA